MRLKHLALATVFALGALPQLASAIPVLWSVNYTNEIGNTAVTGSFVYDADLSQYSAVDLTATDGVGISNTTYNFVSPFPGDPEFRNREDADRTGEKLLGILSFTPLTNMGGIIANNAPSAVFFFFPVRCVDSICNSTQSLQASGNPTASTLTGTPIRVPVPAPATFPLLLAGLGSLAFARRRC